jgi:hypothetical protein
MVHCRVGHVVVNLILVLGCGANAAQSEGTAGTTSGGVRTMDGGVTNTGGVTSTDGGDGTGETHGQEGQCADFTGSYLGQGACAGGQASYESFMATQFECTLTTDSLTNGLLTWEVTGDTAHRNVNELDRSGSCDMTLTGDQYTLRCNMRDPGGSYTCTAAGMRTAVPSGTGPDGGP